MKEQYFIMGPLYKEFGLLFDFSYTAWSEPMGSPMRQELVIVNLHRVRIRALPNEYVNRVVKDILHVSTVIKVGSYEFSVTGSDTLFSVSYPVQKASYTAEEFVDLVSEILDGHNV
jgi:hypothetical protein